MATNLQPFLNTVSSAARQTASEIRARNENMPRSAFGDRFDNALGKAEARRGATQPSIAARSKHAERRHASVPASTDSPTRSPGDKLSGPAADARQEKISSKGDSGQNQEGQDDGWDEHTTKVRKKATQPDMLLPEHLDHYALKSPDGERLNHPGNIVEVYKFAAELAGKTPEEFAGQVADNFHRLFGGLLRDTAGH